jgi:hypothetical protein
MRQLSWANREFGTEITEILEMSKQYVIDVTMVRAEPPIAMILLTGLND